MTYLAVEGIIGAGKSTLAKALAQELGWRLLEEPVDDNPLLAKFYADPKKWGFALQIRMLHNRFRMQQVAAHDLQTCILDRSLPGDRVFARLQVKLQNMDPLEWDTYEQCYNTMSAIRPPFTMLFLMVDPKVAQERMRRRARGVESGVGLDYLEALAQGYEDLVTEIEAGRHHWSRGIRVRRLDWSSHVDDPAAAARELAPSLVRESEGR